MCLDPLENQTAPLAASKQTRRTIDHRRRPGIDTGLEMMTRAPDGQGSDDRPGLLAAGLA